MFDSGVLRALAEEAENAVEGVTEGPWRWTAEDENGMGGPDLVSVSIVPDGRTKAGTREVEEIVVQGWGHDWWGTHVEPTDAAFIAWARTAVPEFARLLRGAAERIDTLEAATVAQLNAELHAIFRPSVDPCTHGCTCWIAPGWTALGLANVLSRSLASPAVSPVPEPTPEAACAECGGTRTVEAPFPKGAGTWRTRCPSCAVPVPEAEGDR